MEKILLLSFVFVLLASSEVNGLQCWRCSSDITDGDFCKDPFDPSAMTETQRKWNYVECVVPPLPNLDPSLRKAAIPVCKRIIQEVNDKIVFARACSWQLKDAAPDSCRYAVTSPDVKMIHCETCTTDGCNGNNAKTLSIYDASKTTTVKPGSGAISGFAVSQVVLLISGLVAFFHRF